MPETKPETSSEQAQLEFTTNAARRVAKLRDMEKKAGLMLRLSVQGGGCSGFSYKFDFEEQKAEDDTIIETDGVQLVVDAMSLEFLSGA
ncbi:MAG: iron-sulfur cluster assembly accessory protein, partial [Alphaproteobacteria bacterium]